MTRRVAIIGAGITGLCCAYECERLGIEAVVFEASERVGGPLRSVKRDGFLAECGPHTIMDSNPAVGELLTRLGISDQRRDASEAAHKRYIVRGGRPQALPASPPAFFKSDTFSRSAKLALLREPFVPRRTDGIDESVTMFVTRRLGEELLDYGVELLVNGVWAGDPNRLSARYAFPKMTGLERDHGSILRGGIAAARSGRPRPSMFAMRDGNASITDAIAAELNDVRLESPVREIRRVANAWEVDGDAFDEVVLTMGGPAFQDVLVEDGAALDFRFLDDIAYPPVCIISFGFRRADIDHPLDAFGMIAPGREHQPILGALFTSSMFEGRAPKDHVTMSCFVGGMRAPELASAPDRVERSVGALSELLGIHGDPVFVEESFYPRAIPQVEVGWGRMLARLDALERKHQGLHITGNIRGRVAVPDLIARGRELAHTLAREA